MKAIIFDMDGVIVDTEFLDFETQRAFIAKENNLPLTNNQHEHRALIGKSYNDLYLTMNDFIDKDYSLSELQENFTAFSQEKYEKIDYLKLFRQDIVSILNYAKQNEIAAAVASSSEYAHIVDILTACNIIDYFDVIYSGEFVKESKPNPEIYRNTLAKLGVDAKNAIAIEDSFYGIAAAKSAGITTIAYKETRMPIDQTAADFIGENMTEIKQIIMKQFNQSKSHLHEK